MWQNNKNKAAAPMDSSEWCESIKLCFCSALEMMLLLSSCHECTIHE